MTDKKTLYLKFFTNIIFVILVIVLLKFFLPYIISLFLPFILGYMISGLAEPIVDFLERKIKIKRKYSSILIISSVIAGIVFCFYLIIKKIVDLIKEIIDNIPVIIETFNDISDKIISLVESTAINGRTIVSSDLLNTVADSLSEQFQVWAEVIISKTSTFVLDVPMFIVVVFITILSAYFMTADDFRIKFTALKTFKNFNKIKENVVDVTVNYLKAQFKITFIIFLILTVCFGLMKLNYFVLIALGVAFIDLLPVFGTGTIIWPWIAISLLYGDYNRAIFLLITYLIALISRQILQPKIISQEIGLPALPTLVFMFVGYKMFGVMGLLLSAPVGLVFIKLNDIGLFDNYKNCVKIIVNDIKNLLDLSSIK